jgi:hypothetical protein
VDSAQVSISIVGQIFEACRRLRLVTSKRGLNDHDLARTSCSPQRARYEGHRRCDQGWSITDRWRQIFCRLGSVTPAIRDEQCHFAAARICRWVRRFPPGQGHPPFSVIPPHPRGFLNARRAALRRALEDQLLDHCLLVSACKRKVGRIRQKPRRHAHSGQFRLIC